MNDALIPAEAADFTGSGNLADITEAGNAGKARGVRVDIYEQTSLDPFCQGFYLDQVDFRDLLRSQWSAPFIEH